MPSFFFRSTFSDIIINNAGILRDRSFARISNDDWGKYFIQLVCILWLVYG